MDTRSRSSQPATPADTARDGVVAALLAYVLWGLLPIYFKVVEDVGALEVLSQRVIWAVPFGAALIALRRQGGEVYTALTNLRVLATLALTAGFIALNWLVYIHAVQSGRIFEASLGYYINPLVYVLAGVVLFGEKLARLQLAAVVLATIGVTVLTVSSGTLPIISLTLAVSFTIYGVLRKRVSVNAMPGLFVETLVLLPAAVVYQVWLLQTGGAAFGLHDPAMMVILILAGPVTVLPLLCFALAARKLRLSTLGFIQFLAPTLQFLMGVVFGEVLTPAHLICFGCIWVAVALFAFNAWRR